MVIPYLYAHAYKVVYGKEIVITRAVFDNLYIAGGDITINAPVHGDLIIAGGTVIINDTVTGDILLAGGSVTFNGFANGDFRSSGGSVHISKNIAGDVAFAGGNLVIDKGTAVGSLLVGGGSAEVNGNVTGEVTCAAGKLTLNGDVGKGIDCQGETITINGTVNGESRLAATSIIIGNTAVFNNNVRYWNSQGILKIANIHNGKAIYDPSLRISKGQWYLLGAGTLIGSLWYIGMALLLIIILQFLFSGTFKSAADSLYNSTGKSLLYGFLFLIAVPAAAIITFITIIGVPVGILLVFIFISVLLLATVISAVVAANWVNNRYNYNWKYWRLVFTALLSFVILKIIFALPLAGWLFMAIITCLSLGGILLNIRWKGKSAQL